MKHKQTDVVDLINQLCSVPEDQLVAAVVRDNNPYLIQRIMRLIQTLQKVS
jgi:hypothetical protein